MPRYTLHYFEAAGRGEFVRIALAAAGVEWQDKRISKDEWPKFKQEMPFGQVPVLEVDGKKIAQTTAIIRFVGRQHGMAGRDSVEQAFVDSIMCAVDELLNEAVIIYYEKDAEKKKALQTKFGTESMPAMLGKLSNLVKSNHTFTGGSPTVAEAYFYTSIESLETQGGGGILDHFPKLQAVYDKVKALPGVAKWIKKRPS